MSAEAWTVFALQAFGTVVLVSVLTWIVGHALRETLDRLTQFLRGFSRRRELEHLRKMEAARERWAEMFDCNKRY